MLDQETITCALKEIAKGEAQRRYFFERAKSPDWLRPLADAGYFKEPPDPVVDGQYISFPPWEQSRYLARMAKIPSAQAAVLSIADAIPKTDNVQVHEDLLDIALEVPAAGATRFVPRVFDWLKSPYRLTLSDKLRQFIAHLASGGEGEAAVEVARKTLAPQPDSRWDERKENELYTPEPQALFDDYDYQGIVHHVISPLVRAVGPQAVTLFADLLGSAIELTRRPGDEGDEDYLYISQEDLGWGPRFDQLPNVLLCATLRAAEEAIKLDPKNFESIVTDLRSRKWVSFRRLILYLCSLFPELGTSEIALQLGDTRVLERPATHFEAKTLLRASFGQLPAKVQDAILQWIERGPNRDSVASWLGEPAAPEQIDDFCNAWRRDQLALLEGQLPHDWEKRLKKLIESLGQPNPLQHPIRDSGGWVRPRSPVASDKLLLLSPEQVVEYLRNWQPTAGLFEPSIEGMGRVLGQVVAERADEYSKAAEEFEQVDPTYVREYFQGLLEARTRGVVFAWGPVLELAAWVVSQSREISGRRGGLRDRDPDWGWTRKAIVNLLKESFCDEPNCLKLQHRHEVWSVLQPLTNDHDPTPQHEAEYGGSNMDPSMMAINTVRGDAFNCLVRFALWVRRGIEKSLPEAEWPPRSFDTMPEVREILDSHLDVAIEPSLTVRSVYGKSLRDLATLDWDWTVKSLARIFPQAPAEQAYLLAAWESYVVFNPPKTALLAILRPYYRAAIDRLSEVPSLMKHPPSPEDRLAEHLAEYYWRGELQLDEAGGLLLQFFCSAPSKVRGHLIWFIGCSVSKWEEGVPSIVFDRLCRLLEWRVRVAQDAASKSEFAAELSRFGLWFKSKRFSDEWSLSILQTVLDLVGQVDLEMSVGERLVELTPRFPLEGVRALTTMIARAKEPWVFMAIKDSAKKVIQIALHSGNPEAAFVARRLAEDLISQQHFEFMNVLKDS